MSRIVRATIFFEGLLLALAWGGGVLCGRSPWEDVALTGTAVGWGVVATGPLLLGLLLIVFDNLAVPIIVHILYDLAALLYLVRLRPD